MGKKSMCNIVTVAYINVLREKEFDVFLGNLRDEFEDSGVSISALKGKECNIVTFRETLEVIHYKATDFTPEEYANYPQADKDRIEELIEEFVASYDYDVFSDWNIRERMRFYDVYRN